MRKLLVLSALTLFLSSWAAYDKDFCLAEAKKLIALNIRVLKHDALVYHWFPRERLSPYLPHSMAAKKYLQKTAGQFGKNDGKFDAHHLMYGGGIYAATDPADSCGYGGSVDFQVAEITIPKGTVLIHDPPEILEKPANVDDLLKNECLRKESTDHLHWTPNRTPTEKTCESKEIKCLFRPEMADDINAFIRQATSAVGSYARVAQWSKYVHPLLSQEFAHNSWEFPYVPDNLASFDLILGPEQIKSARIYGPEDFKKGVGNTPRMLQYMTDKSGQIKKPCDTILLGFKAPPITDPKAFIDWSEKNLLSVGTFVSQSSPLQIAPERAPPKH